MRRDISKMNRKELVAYVASIDVELRDINEKRRAKAADLQAAQMAITAIDRRAEAPTVSDHALVRFIERAKGFDVETIRDQMMPPTVVDAINAGATTITVGGLKFRVREKVITTVMD